jgi:NADPH-dependent ferric siderophore reductase
MASANRINYWKKIKMARRDPRKIKVIGTKRITANMHRVRLGGEGIRDFRKGQEGGYIKLNLSQINSERPIGRTYSVRFQRDNQIDIYFVLHGDGGPPSRWAAVSLGCL